MRARWGRPARASVACAWPAGGLRSALAGPVGLAGAWGFFFELERKKKYREIYIILYRTYIYIKILRRINPTTWTFFQR